MAYKTGERMQPKLLPACIEDYVDPQAPVRVYDAFVDALNFHEIGISLEPSPHGGADEYYPKEMVKLLIYGYSYGTRSSRKLDRACHDNLSFIWLMGDLKPDYRTISRFRSKYKEAIKKILKQCVRICIDLDLIEGNVFFTDGSKFRANASINNTWTKERCEKSLAKIEEHIDQLIDESEQLDIMEDQEPSLVKLKEQIHDKTKLISKIKGVLNKLNTHNTSQLNSTDEDSVKAKSRQGTHAVYNVQSTVDSKHGLIVHAQAVSESNDLNQLSAQVKEAVEIVGKKPQHVCADAGYASTTDLKKIDSEINVIVPSQRQAQADNGRLNSKPFDKEHFVYDPQSDEYRCPEGNRLRFKSFSPDRNKRRYQSKASQCRACPQFGNPDLGKCTQSPYGRRITRLIDEEFKEQLETNYKKPENQKIYQLRKQTVEHPFGHMKRNLGAGQFMLRGKSKVDAEVSILASCFNIVRMMTIVGIVPLLIKLKSG